MATRVVPVCSALPPSLSIAFLVKKIIPIITCTFLLTTRPRIHGFFLVTGIIMFKLVKMLIDSKMIDIL